MLRTLFLYSLLFFLPLAGIRAQLYITPTANANALVSTIVGSGVIVTNVTLNCNGQASGIFSTGSTNLGISNGIILSTGRAVEAIGPNDSPGGNPFSGSGPECFNDDPSFFDPNILAIEPEAKYDGCALEFDIKPVCNTLQIDYVFASEEYPEWVGEVNDVFGFFIWGPNPAGGSYVGTNIATLPGGTPITINNVNAGVNSQYFVNNAGGSTIEYDGFTIPLTASANVSQCATYHLKLAIADVVDCHWSSAVFLANKGITCPANQVPQLTASSTPLNCGNDGSATVNVINSGGPVTYNWQPGGQTTATASNLGAGTYTCTVGFTLPCPFTQTTSVNVSGSNVLAMSASSQNAYCNGSNGSASVSISGGVEPYSVPAWNTVPPQNGNSATSLVPGTYTVEVSDATGCTITKSVTVGNTTPNISTDFSTIQSTCNSANGSISMNSISGGTNPYTYSWNTTPPTATQHLPGIPAGTYSLTITDAENCTAVKEVVVSNSDSVMIDMYSMNEYCDQENGEIHVPVLNGMAPYTWNWSHEALLNDSVATHLPAGTYSFTVTDNAGCVAAGNVILTNIRDEFTGSIYTLPPEPIVNSAFTLGIQLPSAWTLDYMESVDGMIHSDSTATTLTYPEYGLYDVNFYVESGNGCKDTIPFGIFVKDFMTIYIPNAFTPNNDRKNRVWYVYGTLVKSINIYVYDRWGEKLFESHDLEDGWDGIYKGKPCELGVYVYKIEAIDYFNEEFKFVGHITLVR